MLPSCAATISATIASPSPLPPTSRLRAVVEAHEALEDASAGLGGDPRAVVVDAEPDLPVTLGNGERDCAACVTRRVVTEVAHHVAELLAVADHLPAGDRGRVDGDAVAPTQARRLLEHEVVEVDRRRRRSSPVLVGTREPEQVVDEPLEPEVLGEHRPRELVDEVVRGVCLRDLGMLADRRDRAAQLVGGIGHEPALTGLAASRRLSIAFIVRASRAISSSPSGSGTRRWSSACRDLVDLGTDRLNRRERAAHQPPRQLLPRSTRSSGKPMSSSVVTRSVDSSTARAAPDEHEVLPGTVEVGFLDEVRTFEGPVLEAARPRRSPNRLVAARRRSAAVADRGLARTTRPSLVEHLDDLVVFLVDHEVLGRDAALERLRQVRGPQLDRGADTVGERRRAARLTRTTPVSRERRRRHRS